jgi:hypothetical protein
MSKMTQATPEAVIGKCQRLSASEEEVIIIWDSKLLLVDDQMTQKAVFLIISFSARVGINAKQRLPVHVNGHIR